ncbi:DUF4056 domain-containing protein [Shewanella olleyana]|uniref:DUF4056 domain-containing protein n=1 Tax=Shewanella olleyana TaxID=135626 RepID=UPI00200C990E|nr:DUF4056 domain-containing protein [Shewanella olleyana]MCL1066385.1 DUF4056 domain-containing protein [Shewanella olleyana]
MMFNSQIPVLLFSTGLMVTLLTSCSSNEWQVSATPSNSAVSTALDNQPDPVLLRDIALPQQAAMTLPTSVRPCCAFGNAQKVKLGAMTIPFYRHANTISLEELGAHAYEAGSFSHQKSAPDEGRSGENNGIVYTRKGGFIDLAHVRDTADNAVALFYQIHPNLGEKKSIALPFEIGPRTIEIDSFEVNGLTATQRWELSAAMAARLAYSMAEAHEIAQYHGYRSFGPWSEAVSAYSPEDLYSNMLGAKIALAVITNNLAMTRQQFNYHMTSWVAATIDWLEPVSANETNALFNVIDGYWWDSNEPMPNKFMLLNRHYELGDHQSPYLVPIDMAKNSDIWSDVAGVYKTPKVAHDLSLANTVHGINIDEVAKQWLYVDAKFESNFEHIPTSLWRDGFNQHSFLTISRHNEILDEQLLNEHLSLNPDLPLAIEQTTQGDL